MGRRDDYNGGMLERILGSETAAKIMLHVYHYGEIHPSAVASDYDMAKSAVQNQFQRFEEAGVLVSKLVGRTRLYSFNKKSPVTRPFMELIKIYYESLTIKDKEKIFKERRRPRRAGKPVIGRGSDED